MKLHEWMSSEKIAAARQTLRTCPEKATRDEGMACLRGARPEYLCNLIKQDHPDRIAAVRYLSAF